MDYVPLVTIIINNYNYSHFVGAAIRSALEQTYSALEIVVVDDGSTDGSREVIESFGHRIRTVFKHNAGQGSAYNAGFASSLGELIHFLDSDDLLDPTAIEEAVKRWRPGVSKVHFYLSVIEGVDGISTDALIPAGALPEGDLCGDLLKTGSYLSPPSSGNLYSREVLSNILPMPEKEWVTEADLYCIFQSPFFGMVRSVPNALGRYRIHDRNCNAVTTLTGKVLRNKLRDEMRRDALLRDVCRRQSISYAAGSVANNVGHQKIRLASLRFEPDLHPFKGDRLFTVFARGLRLCVLDKTLSPTQRIMLSVWSVAMVLSPRRILPYLLQIGFVPSLRPKRWQRFLKPKTA